MFAFAITIPALSPRKKRILRPELSGISNILALRSSNDQDFELGNIFFDLLHFLQELFVLEIKLFDLFTEDPAFFGGSNSILGHNT